MFGTGKRLCVSNWTFPLMLEQCVVWTDSGPYSSLAHRHTCTGPAGASSAHASLETLFFHVCSGCLCAAQWFSALCVSQARKARDGDGAQTNGGPLVLKDAENMQDSTES